MFLLLASSFFFLSLFWFSILALSRVFRDERKTKCPCTAQARFQEEQYGSMVSLLGPRIWIKPIHQEPLNNRLPDTLISNSDKSTNYPLSFPASLGSKVTSFNPALSTFTFTFTSSQTPFPLNFHNRPTLPLNLSPLPPPLPSLLTNPFTVINPAFLRSRDPLPLHPVTV